MNLLLLYYTLFIVVGGAAFGMFWLHEAKMRQETVKEICPIAIVRVRENEQKIEFGCRKQTHLSKKRASTRIWQ